MHQYRFVSRRLVTLMAAVTLTGFQSASAAAEPVEQRIGEVVALGDLENPNATLEEGPVVLMVHGTFAHKDQETIEAMQAALSERGVASLAITLTLGQDRRTGLLPCEGVHRHRHDDAVGEIAAWTDWLQQAGTERIVLLGHSRGGSQAALYLRGEPAPSVVGAVLLAPLTEDPDKAAEAYRQRFGVAPAEVAAGLQDGPAESTSEVPGFAACEDATVSRAAFLSYHSDAVERDTPTLLKAGVPVPVLVIAAEADEVVTDLPEKMEPLADGERLRFGTVAGADHRFLDFYSEDVADLVTGFLDDLPR